MTTNPDAEVRTAVPASPVHHIELWTEDLPGIEHSFEWLLPQLGFDSDHDPAWAAGRIWRHETGTYVVLEQSPAITPGAYDRNRTGLNHLAFWVESTAHLDALREAAAGHGWEELYPGAYPHAGGPDGYAHYLVNAQGFEIELVARR